MRVDNDLDLKVLKSFYGANFETQWIKCLSLMNKLSDLAICFRINQYWKLNTHIQICIMKFIFVTWKLQTWKTTKHLICSIHLHNIRISKMNYFYETLLIYRFIITLSTQQSRSRKKMYIAIWHLSFL